MGQAELCRPRRRLVRPLPPPPGGILTLAVAAEEAAVHADAPHDLGRGRRRRVSAAAAAPSDGGGPGGEAAEGAILRRAEGRDHLRPENVQQF